MKIDFKGIGQFALIMIIGAVIIVTTSWLVNRTKRPDIIEKITQVLISKPQCLNAADEYKALVSSGQSIRIVSEMNMYAANNRLINRREVLVNRSGKDDIACGYLYVRARRGNGSWEEKYDSVFIEPNSFGGHILSKKGNLLSEVVQGKTEFLLPLDSIAYLPSVPFNPDAQNYNLANWTNLLNVSNQSRFIIGLSSLSQLSFIEEIGVVYKCWNRETGKESSDCQLSVFSNKPI